MLSYLLGFDETLLQKMSSEEQERQKYIFEVLSLMLLVVSGLSFFGFLFFSLILCNSIIISLIVASFSTVILFNCYRFLIIISLITRNERVGHYHSNSQLLLEPLRHKDLSGLTEMKIRELVNTTKDKIRKAKPKQPSKYRTSHIITFLIKLSFLILTGFIVANGIEIFIYRNEINSILSEVKNNIQGSNSWLLNEALSTDNGNFLLIDCNSMLIIIKLLFAGLSDKKIYLDIFLILIFVLPFLLIHISREFSHGSYLKEQALGEISISLYHTLHTLRYKDRIVKEQKKTIYQIKK